MRYRYLIGALAIFGVLAAGGVCLWLSGSLITFEGAGPIATEEASLMLETTLLMLVVAIPVLFLLFFFAWRYRAGNKSARFEPEWEHSPIDELVWWAVPFEIILVLGAITWFSTHSLDPHKPLPAQGGALSVEVVALPWKWLFIYPLQGIATVNYLEIPVGVPVNFSITSDAPMNSFWVPQLGGQIYAMTGMVNPLSLEALSPGTYKGGSANYSGEHFADMNFDVRAVNKSEFDAWAAHAHGAASAMLDQNEFEALAYPSTSTPGYYGAVSPGLFNFIVDSFDWGFTSGGAHNH